MEIWAHRGSHGGGLLENTLPAFERALAEGADGIELDVRASADGHALVIHDADLRRVGGDRRRVEARPSADTLAVRLPGGARVPLLGEVLALVGGRIPVNVELKSVSSAAAAAAALRPADRVVVSSFIPAALARFRALAPQVPRALLTDRAVGQGPPWALLRGLRCAAWHANHRRLTGSEIRVAQARGFAIRAYTVRHIGDARRLAAMGVGGVFVDEAGAFRRRLRG